MTEPKCDEQCNHPGITCEEIAEEWQRVLEGREELEIPTPENREEFIERNLRKR